MSQIIVGSNGGGGGGGTTSFQTDAGTATPLAGVIQILGDVDITTSGAGNVITVTGAIATALDFDADTGTATPAGNTINIVGGTNVTTSATGDTITINATGGGLMPWIQVTSGTVNLAVNTGYVFNFVTAVTATLPSVCAFGDVITILGNKATHPDSGFFWRVVAPGGISIYAAGAFNATPIAYTSATCSDYGGSISFVCTQANTSWQAYSSTANINYTT